MSIPHCKSRNKQNTTKHYKNKKNNNIPISNSEQNQIKIIRARINKFFHGTDIDKIAKKVGYLIRTSPITPFIFLQAVSLGMSGKEISLNLLASNTNSFFNTSITGSALSQRMAKKESVLFLKTCFSEVLSLHLKSTFKNKVMDMFPMFKAIMLEDSTGMQLSEEAKKFFKGCGGAASKSSVKLNFLFNVCVFGIEAISICPGKVPDRSLANECIKHLKKGMLIVRDMGYFVLKTLGIIHEKGAYYLSRLPKGTCIYLNRDDKEPLDIEVFFKEKTRKNKTCQVEVFLGKEERFSTTLILQKIPNSVLKLRIKKYKKKNSGKSPSEDFITWAKYSVFITNIPEELLINNGSSFGELIIEIYKIRWQIELLFKKFKSKIKLHHIKGKGKNQIFCLIYGKLISILLNVMVLSYAASLSYMDREISLWKVNAWLLSKDRLAHAILDGTLDGLYLDLCKHFRLLCKDRRNRKTALERLEEALDSKKEAA